MSRETTLDKIVSLAKRRGFIYPGSEIYGGLSGTWDYGPLGVALKNNVKNLWWRMFVLEREDMYGVDATILMHPRVWEASGHVAGFSDPLVECAKCKRRYRADDGSIQLQPGEGKEFKWICPQCKWGNVHSEVRQFNMMFRTYIGATEDASAVTYLRPETAGGIFSNFKNIVDSFHTKLPFGVAQIGKAFRNEIAPRDFLFRVREMEQMEVEYFVRPEKWEESFEMLRRESLRFIGQLGIPRELVHETEVSEKERAHYSKRTVDFEFDFPFGRKELFGLAYRTDFDLSAHSEASGVELKVIDEDSKESVTPHVIEPSFGVDRLVLALLTSVYAEDELGGEKRTYLKFNSATAPIKAAVFPLLKNKPELVAKAREVYANLKQQVFHIQFDDNGNIGKRYRRQDEIGTPMCITIDFETLENDTVTVRDRDTSQQKRVAIPALPHIIIS